MMRAQADFARLMTIDLNAGEDMTKNGDPAEAERSLAAASTAIAAPAAVAGGVAQVTKEGLRLEVVAVNYDA